LSHPRGNISSVTLDDFLIFTHCIDPEGCDGPVKSWSLCAKHYARHVRAGTQKVARQLQEEALEGIGCVACDKPRKSRIHQLCEMHYARVSRNGSLERVNRGPTGECGQCGKKIQGRSFCNERCYTRFRRGRVEGDMECLLCGARRSDVRSDAIYCTKKCAMKASNLRANYGLQPETFREMLRLQEGRCAICANEFAEDLTPHVDHCHETGVVRGLLCSPCNSGIGFLGDDPQRLIAASAYVASWA